MPLRRNSDVVRATQERGEATGPRTTASSRRSAPMSPASDVTRAPQQGCQGRSQPRLKPSTDSATLVFPVIRMAGTLPAYRTRPISHDRPAAPTKVEWMGEGDGRMARDRGGLAAAIGRLGTARAERRGYLAVGLTLTATVLAFRGVHEHTHEHAAVALALLLVARAVALGRSLRATLLAFGAALLVVAYAADNADHLAISWTAIAAAGAVAGLPRRPPPAATAADRRHVWALVDGTAGDALAPFALRSDKAYVFSEARRAAVGYRVRVGTAIAGGDPVGDPSSYADAVDLAVGCTLGQVAYLAGWPFRRLGAGQRQQIPTAFDRARSNWRSGSRCPGAGSATFAKPCSAPATRA